MISILYFFILFSVFVERGEVVVIFRKKVRDGNISISRSHKYTDKHIPSYAKPEFNSTLEARIDVLMVADYSLYNSFVEISRGETTVGQNYVRQYLAAVFDQAKAIYDGNKMSNNRSLELHLAAVLVTIREEDCPLMTEYDTSNNTDNSTVLLDWQQANSTQMSISMQAHHALERLKSWLLQHDDILPRHDHAVLITKFDLINPRGSSLTQGLAYVKQICKKGESASVVEDLGGATTALIVAHEIAHNLGAMHDGTSNASVECSGRNNYLMSPTVSGSYNETLFANARKFSKCTIEQIEETFRTKEANCVWKQKYTRPRNNLARELQILPGERFTLPQQCQIAYGPHYGPCPVKDYYRNLSVCRQVWCKNRQEKRSDPCETHTYFPALDGTECGRNKWCVAGNCIPNPKKMLDCKDLNRKTCSRYSKVKLRHYCKSEEFMEICCASCTRQKELSKAG